MKKSDCPFLRVHWVDHEDCEAFNGLARTLMRFGVVDYMGMDAQVSRYSYSPDDDGYGTYDYEECVYVSVGVVVDDKEETYEIYEDYY